MAAGGGAALRAAVALPFPATQCVVPGSTPMGSGGGVRCAGRGFEGGPGTPGKSPGMQGMGPFWKSSVFSVWKLTKLSRFDGSPTHQMSQILIS